MFKSRSREIWRTSKDNGKKYGAAQSKGGLSVCMIDPYDKERAFWPSAQWHRSNDIVQGVLWRLHKLHDFYSYSKRVIKRIVSRWHWCSLHLSAYLTLCCEEECGRMLVCWRVLLELKRVCECDGCKVDVIRSQTRTNKGCLYKNVTLTHANPGQIDKKTR